MRRRRPPAHPLILALDTSTTTLSIAISADHLCLANFTLLIHRGHSTDQLAFIHQLLQRLSLTIDDIDALAIGLGPGSFTGLRVGLALMKGMALASEKPLYGFSSLAATAQGLAQLSPALICPCVDARKGEVYAGLYQATLHDFTPVLPERVLHPKKLAEALSAHLAENNDTRPILFVGSGAAVYQDLFVEHLPERAKFLPQPLAPDAFQLCRMTRAALKEGPPPPMATLEPRYLRISDAEMAWIRKQDPKSP